MNTTLTPPKKPVTVAREETARALADVINQAGLPAFILEPILRELLGDIQNAMREQYQKEKAQYEQALKKYNEGNGTANDKNPSV